MKIQKINNDIRMQSSMASKTQKSASANNSSKVSFGKKGSSSNNSGSNAIGFAGMLPVNVLEHMSANKADNLLNNAAAKNL